MVRPFQPLPFLGNPHVQTVLGSLLPSPRFGSPCDQCLVELPDGDKLVLHDSSPRDWQPKGLLAVLVHGMGGTHDSGYMRRLAAVLVRRAVRVVRLDLRGCGLGVKHARRTYNAACSPDVRAALAHLHRRHPAARLALVGFSLGGNIVLKLGGELPAQPVPGLDRIVAVAPPVDLEACSALISQPRHRLYELHFLRALIQQVRQLERLHADLPGAFFPRPLTLRIFDDIYTAPRGGFAGVADYYLRASAAPLLHRIPLPTLIVTARDDPFVAVEPLESFARPGPVQVEIIPQGGHLGFLGRNGAGGVRWLEPRIAQWLCAS